MGGKKIKIENEKLTSQISVNNIDLIGEVKG